MLLFLLYLMALIRGLFNHYDVLPPACIGKDITVRGVIVSRPVINQHSQQFLLQVQSTPLRDHRIKLAWYGQPPTRLQVDQQWQLLVRLKPPHGYHNPGGFDYQAYAKRQNLSAVGYVRKSPINHCLNSSSSVAQLLKWRTQIANRIPNSANRGIIEALTLGFHDHVSSEQRLWFQSTGTSHLMAISGLHIGLMAGMVFVLVSALTRLYPRLLLYCPKSQIAAVGAILAAIGYSGLAGFSVSTQRALVMILSWMLSTICLPRVTAAYSLSLAFAVVLIIDPNALYAPGCWLSFGAVAMLLYALSHRPHQQGWWWRTVYPQWVCGVGLLPLTIWYFHSISLTSLLANLVAIPWVSFVVVPLCLLGLAIPPLFGLANAAISVLLWFLQLISFSIPWSMPSVTQLVVAIIGVICLFAPRGLKIRVLAVFACFALLFPPSLEIAPGHFQLVTLDVGQGLACLIRTQHHQLLFDAGPKFDGFDAGEHIIEPYCHYTGIKRFDVAVISHGDNDHIGGLDAVRRRLGIDRIYGSDLKKIQAPATLCDRHYAWTWEGVHFAFLNHCAVDFRKDNNRSCVLKVSGATGSLLLTGDIERQAEQLLLQHPADLASSVIVVPHHGSKTSSSWAFVQAVHPKIAVFSYGYLNRFHHPSPRVVQRYERIGATLLNTVELGAITLML